MNGLTHITQTFASTQAQGRAALMPYYTLGYPDMETSLSILEAVACSGADLLELGIPFSDPLADGPTIQHSTQVALEQGMTVSRSLELVSRLRARGITQPLLLMGYYNPILSYRGATEEAQGVAGFVAGAAAAGADGFIVPDLPPEEAEQMEAACQAYQLALVYLLAPTSTPERIALVAARTSGFLYLVSLTGVTGAREALPLDLADFVRRVRAVSSLPMAVGFGIATPEQAHAVGQLADGVIVGSALINAVDRAADPARTAAGFVSSLYQALLSTESMR